MDAIFPAPFPQGLMLPLILEIIPALQQSLAAEKLLESPIGSRDLEDAVNLSRLLRHSQLSKFQGQANAKAQVIFMRYLQEIVAVKILLIQLI
mgnify:CR=1 FL=1